MTNKLSIHFILPAGGVKGCFQAGFLYRLFKSYSSCFEVYQIDGCSVGAINGYAACKGQFDYFKEMWDNVNSFQDLFSSPNVPVVSNLITFYNGFYKKGFYKNNKLSAMIEGAEKEDNNCTTEKFNCVVTNINTGEYEYINGTNKNIKEYVIASASPWIVASPLSIDNKFYMDGALLQTYPTKYIKNSKADKIVVLGYDPIHFFKTGKCGDNIVTHLARIIDICRINNNNIEEIKKLYLNCPDNMLFITNPIHMDFINFNKEMVSKGFMLGEMAAATFALHHFKIPIEDSKQLLFTTTKTK
jgi:predicted acylesterase/phospholipase RssA